VRRGRWTKTGPGRRINGKTYLVARQLTNISYASVCDGDDLDKLSIIDRIHLPGGEEGPEIDAPVGTQPDEALRSDNGADPDKSPLRCTDVRLVELRGEVEGQENGPYYSERPDIGVQ